MTDDLIEKVKEEEKRGIMKWGNTDSSPSILLNAAATHCPRGHPYDLFNTLFTKQGKRSCRMCHNLRRYRKGGASYEPIA